mmetsp:Transcript_36252/g.41798  ORF Transcript_36252/g.41798 Transcript_36252/m.41798 type:complete len:214 (+) Transcript_36252:184-825(+)
MNRSITPAIEAPQKFLESRNNMRMPMHTKKHSIDNAIKDHRSDHEGMQTNESREKAVTKSIDYLQKFRALSKERKNAKVQEFVKKITRGIPKMLSKKRSVQHATLNFITPKNKMNSFMDGFEHSKISMNMQERVFNYTKSNKIQLSQLHDIRTLLIDCRLRNNDLVDKDEFVRKVDNSHFKYPKSFFRSLLRDIEVDKNTLSYKKFIDVYNTY